MSGTTELRITYRKEASPKLVAYSDASYANNVDDRKSTSAYLFLKNGGAVSWRSKKQSIIAKSPMESEYIALTDAVKEGQWLSHLEKSLRGKTDVITYYEDNQSAIHTAKNPIHYDRSKHIDVRYHFIRDLVRKKEIEIVYLPTAEMIVNALTKPIQRVLNDKLRAIMGLS